MALQYTVRPISDRSAFTGARTGSPFTVKWHQVLDLLEREYNALDGKHLVIEVDVAERAIRNDGTLRSDARSSSPAVRVAFESKHGPISMATDRFVRQSYRSNSMDDWQHNVYAIAKALEALRMVDRYGVSRSGEQYRGYKQLAAGNGAVSSRMTLTDALAVIRAASGSLVPADQLPPGELAVLVRLAQRRTHPDHLDGDRTQWDRVEEARQLLTGLGRLPSSPALTG